MNQDILLYWPWKNIEAQRKHHTLPFITSKTFCGTRAGILEWRVGVGDVVWITSSPLPAPNELYLCGHLRIKRLTNDVAEVVKAIGRKPWIQLEYYALTGDAQGDCFKEINITDLAALLRFENGLGRLQLEHGRVDGRRMQALRVLTPQSAALLREKWLG